MEDDKTVDRTSNSSQRSEGCYLTMPRELTAENGAKKLFIGEFSECITINNPVYCGCGECADCRDDLGMIETISQEVIIEWSTIKRIYQKAVEHFASSLGGK